MPREYADILIHIQTKDERTGAYRVEAELDDGSRYKGGLRLDQESLLEKLLKPEAYGLEMFHALFAGPIRQAYDRVLGRAGVMTGGRVRVRLWIDEDAAELHALPWERLYHIPGEQPLPLTTSARTPFSRYTGLALAEPAPLSEDPIGLLCAVANPSDLPRSLEPVDVEGEIRAFREALGELGLASRFQVAVLPGHTGLSTQLRREVEQDGYKVLEGATTLNRILHHLPHFRVLHFVGHGAFRRGGPGAAEPRLGTAVLYLETEEGKRKVVRDGNIVPRLAAIDPLPHLVFLEACQSAARPDERGPAGKGHPWVGLGPGLVRAGVPAVVAMQERVPMDLAQALTGHFYRELLEHGLVDRALNVARNLLFEAGRVDWAIPVLFMRLKTGELVRAAQFPRDKAAGKPGHEVDPLAYDQDYYEARFAAIRELMRDAFTPEELIQFCGDRDDFRRARSRFGFGFSLDDLIDAVLTYAEKRVLLPQLLAGIQQANPRRFREHQGGIYG